MTRAENWKLVLQICEEMQDEVVASVRIALLDTFGKTEEFCKPDHVRQLAKCLQSFFPKRKARIPLVPPGRLMILFPSGSGSNLLNLLPVAQEAKRRGMLGGIVAGDYFRREKSNALAEFEAVITQQNLYSLVGSRFLPGSLKRASQRLKRLIARTERTNSSCAAKIRQSYGGYINLMVESERMSLAHRKLLQIWKPSVFFSTSDFWPFEFQCCWQAKQLGIPTAIVQHGAINDVCAWPTYHDVFLAWGETFRQQLETSGAPAERIRVIGMPASDSLFSRANQKLVNTAGSKPVCLIFSHTQDRIEESALFQEYGQLLIKAIQSAPNVTWRIRLHPAEDDAFYREIGILKFNNVEMESKSVSLEDSIEAASVVCTIRSTAGLQAMMLRKPLIVLRPKALSTPPVVWPELGGGIYARNFADLADYTQRLVNDRSFLLSLLDSQEKFLEQMFTNRGSATISIVDFLEEQMKTTVRNANDITTVGDLINKP